MRMDRNINLKNDTATSSLSLCADFANMDPCVSSTTQIPYDILTSIIDELALRNQFEDISACSQTCRMLLHPCRVHLFSSGVTIVENAPQFAASLKKNPEIQVYIQKLTYSPVVLSKDLANAFLLLSNLNTLVLQGHGSSYSDWRTLTPYMQHALSHLFSSVTRIMIENFLCIPTNLLSNCSNLKHLHINRRTIFESVFSNTTVLAPAKLVTLDIAKAPSMTVASLLNKRRASLRSKLDPSSLQSLTFRISGPRRAEYLEQIWLSTPKLKHMCLRVRNHTGLTLDSLVEALICSWPTTRSFKMECNTEGYEFSDIIPRLFKALQALAHHSDNINEINLTLRSPRFSFHAFAKYWERIDQLLADRSTFRQLEKLSIKFWTKRVAPEKWENDRLTKFRVTNLARLSSASEEYLDFQVGFDDAEYESGWTVFSLRFEEHLNTS